MLLLQENEIIYSDSFRSGESYSISGTLCYMGYITNSSKDLRIGIVLPKLINKLNVTVNSLKVNIRGTTAAGTTTGMGTYVYRNGETNSYTEGGKDITSLVSSTIYKNGNNLTLTCSYSNGWTTGTGKLNNYPVAVEINALTLTFS